jgi:hypothetical protein
MSYEDQYIQYTNGFLAEERWQASKAALRYFLRDEANMSVRQAFERLPERWASSFQEVVNELIVEIDRSKDSG